MGEAAHAGERPAGRVFFFQAEDGIRDGHVTGVQTCALPISKEPREAGDAAAAVAEAVAKKPSRAKKEKLEDEAPAEIKPAATIVKPRPVVPAPEVDRKSVV